MSINVEGRGKQLGVIETERKHNVQLSTSLLEMPWLKALLYFEDWFQFTKSY